MTDKERIENLERDMDVLKGIIIKLFNKHNPIATADVIFSILSEDERKLLLTRKPDGVRE